MQMIHNPLVQTRCQKHTADVGVHTQWEVEPQGFHSLPWRARGKCVQTAVGCNVSTIGSVMIPVSHGWGLINDQQSLRRLVRPNSGIFWQCACNSWQLIVQTKGPMVFPQCAFTCFLAILFVPAGPSTAVQTHPAEVQAAKCTNSRCFRKNQKDYIKISTPTVRDIEGLRACLRKSARQGQVQKLCPNMRVSRSGGWELRWIFCWQEMSRVAVAYKNTGCSCLPFQPLTPYKNITVLVGCVSGSSWCCCCMVLLVAASVSVSNGVGAAAFPVRFAIDALVLVSLISLCMFPSVFVVLLALALVAVCCRVSLQPSSWFCSLATLVNHQPHAWKFTAVLILAGSG